MFSCCSSAASHLTASEEKPHPCCPGFSPRALFWTSRHFEKYFLSCRAVLWDITKLYCREFNLMSLRIESNPSRSLRMTRLLCSGALTQHSVDLPESFCQKALFKTVNFSCICVVCIVLFCEYLCVTVFQSGGQTCHSALFWKVSVSELSSGWKDPLWITFTVQENKDELRRIQVICLCAAVCQRAASTREVDQCCSLSLSFSLEVYKCALRSVLQPVRSTSHL